VLGARVALRQEQLLAEAAGGRARGDAAQRVCGRRWASSTGEKAEEDEHEEARGRGERSSWAHHVRRCLLYSPLLNKSGGIRISAPVRPDATQPDGYRIGVARNLRWVRLRLNSDFIDFWFIFFLKKGLAKVQVLQLLLPLRRRLLYIFFY
jgi:hypothetical protein